ncbi:MAG: hypothetical protein ACLGPL_06785 [Acidobacteriota bacterium]
MKSAVEWPKRWTPLIPHPEQVRLIHENRRFKVVPAGRRSGKTERAKRHIVREAFREKGYYFYAAPTRDQAKRIAWNDLKALVPVWFKAKPPSETELIIFLQNGSELHVIGLDKPERIEGIPWSGGVIDEIANCKPNAWAENIRPALDTIGLDAWAWLIGVPEGLNHYYDLAEYSRTSGDPEWGYYHWKSADILPAKAIEAAKRQLSPRQFRQEYEASFETASGRVYDDYSNENHTDRVFDPKRPIIWSHDFNYVPLSSVIMQRDGNSVYAVDEIVLEGAVARQAALEFVERYKDHTGQTVRIFGDASGNAGAKHGHKSDYIEIQEILKRAGFKVQMMVRASNPAIKDGQNSLRAKILNAVGERTFFVNPARCKVLDKGMKTTQLMEGSTFQEKDSPWQHITTAVRYYTAVEFPVGHTGTKPFSPYG